MEAYNNLAHLLMSRSVSQDCGAHHAHRADQNFGSEVNNVSWRTNRLEVIHSTAKVRGMWPHQAYADAKITFERKTPAFN